jgi:hypothetical protein
VNDRSDHAPITFSLSCNNNIDYNDDIYVSRYKWSQVYRDSFRVSLIGQLPLLNQLVHGIEPTKNCINDVVSGFTNIVKDSTDKYSLK